MEFEDFYDYYNQAPEGDIEEIEGEEGISDVFDFGETTDEDQPKFVSTFKDVERISGGELGTKTGITKFEKLARILKTPKETAMGIYNDKIYSGYFDDIPDGKKKNILSKIRNIENFEFMNPYALIYAVYYLEKKVDKIEKENEFVNPMDIYRYMRYLKK